MLGPARWRPALIAGEAMALRWKPPGQLDSLLGNLILLQASCCRPKVDSPKQKGELDFSPAVNRRHHLLLADFLESQAVTIEPAGFLHKQLT